MSSRRELLRLMGITPVLAKAAAGELMATLAAPSTKAIQAVGLAAAANAGPVAHEESYGPFGKILVRRLEFLREVADGQEFQRGRRLADGFDHDIAALKSTSRTFKALKQTVRDNASVEENVRVRKSIWGDMTGLDI